MRCVDCHREKLAAEFFPSALKRRSARCKTCHRDRMAGVKARNREKYRAMQRNWRAANPERDAAHRHNERYRTRSNALRQEQRAIDGDAIRLADRRRQHTRRARMRDAFRENVDLATVWARDAGVCGICGLAADPGDWHLDHVTPLAAGGEHSYANTQVSHPRCNQQKGARVAA